MDPDDQKRLRANFAEIVKTVRTEDVIDSLFADGILTGDDLDELDMGIAGMSQRKATRELLKRLPKRGPGAFSSFIKSLKIEDIHTWLAEKILNSDISGVREFDEVDSFTEKEKIEEMKKQILVQSKMLTEFYCEKSQLEAKLMKLQPNATVIKEERYSLLNETMKQNDWGEETVVAFLKQCLEGKFVPHLKPQGGSAKASADPTSEAEDVCDYADITEEEMIARVIGKFIVKHMMFRDTANSLYCIAPDEYSERMQRLVDELIHLYEDAFHGYLQKLNIDEINGFETLANIGNVMFDEGEQNWGRVVTFYAFGSFLAKHFGESDVRIADNIGNFLGFFIARKMGPWIKETGGWRGFLERFPENSLKDESGGLGGWKNALFTFMGLGAIVGIVAVKSGTNP